MVKNLASITLARITININNYVDSTTLMYNVNDT